MKLDFDRALVNRYLSLTHESVFYLDPHICMRCHYRSTELLWQCPQCHEWNTFVEERIAPAEDAEETEDTEAPEGGAGPEASRPPEAPGIIHHTGNAREREHLITMLRVALTGGIATGKSYVLRLLQTHGIPTIDADELARAAVEPGRPAHAAIREPVRRRRCRGGRRA